MAEVHVPTFAMVNALKMDKAPDPHVFAVQELGDLAAEASLAELRGCNGRVRQLLEAEQQTAKELELALAKARAENASARQCLEQELHEAAVAKEQLQEAKKKRKESQKQLQECERADLEGTDPQRHRLQDLLSQARTLIASNGDRAAGANKLSLAQAREAASMVQQLEGLGYADDELYRALLQLGLQNLERHLEHDHPEVLACAQSLAVSLENLGDKNTAVKFYQRVFESRSLRLGKEHPDTLDSAYNLAVCLRGLGQVDEAEALFRATMRGCQSAFGNQNPGTLESAEQLAEILEARSELVAAWGLRRQLLEWYRAAYGEEDLTALGALSKLANVLAAAAVAGSASPPAAAEALRAAYSRHKQVLGLGNLDTLSTAKDMATFLSGCGNDPASAEAVLRECVDVCWEQLGACAPETLTSVENLAEHLESKGRIVEADTILRRLANAQRGDLHSTAKSG
ncbi:unnamed protein product [Effrenium voratum]|nr:unnamed protein product [Effrenium voratum]